MANKSKVSESGSCLAYWEALQYPPKRRRSKPKFQVYAILAVVSGLVGPWKDRGALTYAVSAESEYGAVKRFAAFYCARILDVELIPGRKPEYAERRIEGYTTFDWKAAREDDGEGNPHHTWQYRL